jgi:hypothetical protein
MNNIDQILFKICSTCTISKSISDFHKNKKGKFGRNSICKSCVLAKCRKPLPKFPELSPSPSSPPLSTMICQACDTCLDISHFYENPTSQSGFMKICRNCYIHRDQSADLSIINYSTLLLHQFQRKYSKKIFHISPQQIAHLWNLQRGLCAITEHPMTMVKDTAGNIDNIWNMTLFLKNTDQKNITISDILLVCHLIRTMERKYGFTFEKMREIYKELVTD